MLLSIAAHFAFCLPFVSKNNAAGSYLLTLAGVMLAAYAIGYGIRNRLQKWKPHIPIVYIANLMAFDPLIWNLAHSMTVLLLSITVVVALSAVHLKPQYVWFTSITYVVALAWMFPRYFPEREEEWKLSVLLLPIVLALVLHYLCWNVRRTIHEIRQLEQRENVERLGQQQHLAIIGQIAASIAHDIRNPLTSIKGFVQLIEQNERRSTYQEYYRIIGSEISRIDTMLREVLMLSKSHTVDSSEYTLVNLEGILRRLVLLMEPDAIKSDIQIRLHCDHLPYVEGSEEKLQQVFLNLLRNAFEAIRASGKIDIILRERDGRAEVRIRDSGPGIPVDKLPHLFTPFFTTKAEGTGLGLAICKTIVEAYGGTIAVDNLPGRGAEFLVSFPAQAGDKLPEMEYPGHNRKML